MQKSLPTISANTSSPWHKVDPGNDVPTRFNVITHLGGGAAGDGLFGIHQNERARIWK
jgi:hypothetical protein